MLITGAWGVDESNNTKGGVVDDDGMLGDDETP